jgi:hypothetical protein
MNSLQYSIKANVSSDNITSSGKINNRKYIILIDRAISTEVRQENLQSSQQGYRNAISPIRIV